MNKRIIVCGIVKSGNKILLGKKQKGIAPYPDVWHTLGGGVDDFDKALKILNKKDYNNEYFLNELKRELLEEANILVKNIENICPIFRKNPREAVTKNKFGEDIHYVFLEYICELNSGEVRAGDDIAEVKWVNVNDLGEINLTPPSQEMYRELGFI